MKHRTVQLETSPRCPNCGHTLNGATSIGHEQDPTPGDLTVCIDCASPLEFTPELGLRRIDLETLPSDARCDIERAISLVKAAMRKEKYRFGAPE